MIRMIVNDRHNQCKMPTVHGHKCCSVHNGCERFGETNTYLMDVGSFHDRPGRCFGFSNPSSADDPISSAASAAPIGAHDRKGLRYRLKAKAEAGRGVTGKRTIKKGRTTRSHSPNGRTKIPSDTDRGAIEWPSRIGKNARANWRTTNGTVGTDEQKQIASQPMLSGSNRYAGVTHRNAIYRSDGRDGRRFTTFGYSDNSNIRTYIT